MKVDRWLNAFRDLDPEDQLEVAKVILEELELNNESFDEEEYMVEESEEVSKVFNVLVERMSTKNKLEANLDKIRRFKDLTLEHQDEVLHCLVKCIDETYQKQEQSEKEEVCEREGHTFTKWKHDSWTQYVDTVIDHQEVHGLECLHEEWTRTCKRCGYKEVVEIEPTEVREARLKKEKLEKIKELEEEIKRLKKQ